MQLNRAMGAIPALVGDQGGKAVDCNYLCFSIWNSFSEFILDGIFLYIFGICLLIIFFVFFSLGGSYPFYLLYFGAKIFHLHAHLAFGFWLMAFDFGFGFT